MKAELNDSKSNVVSPDEIAYVVGRPVRNVYAIMFAIFLSFFTLETIGVPELFFAALFTDVLFYLIFAFTVHYFGVSKHILEIRRFYLPGWRKQYRVSDISKVRIIYGVRGTIGLRVILVSGRVRSYGSIALRYDDWVSLMQLLRDAGVTVESEID